jgi:hypothetical protein
MLSSIPLLGGCLSGMRSKPQTEWELKRYLYLVKVPGSKITKYPKNTHVLGRTHAGQLLFKTTLGRGGLLMIGLSRKTFPRWVRVTYSGPFDNTDKLISDFRGRWSSVWDPGDEYFGEVFAEYHVEVLSRIPEEVFEFVSGETKKEFRRLVINFYIDDEGVLFGWHVYVDPRIGPRKGLTYDTMHGGELYEKYPPARHRLRSD